jgi:hypothetical protein
MAQASYCTSETSLSHKVFPGIPWLFSMLFLRNQKHLDKGVGKEESNMKCNTCKIFFADRRPLSKPK